MLYVLIGINEEREMKKNGSEFFKDSGTLVKGDKLKNLNSVRKGEFTICGDSFSFVKEYPVYGGSWFMVENCSENNSVVTHFAWRNSTGTPPTYTNLVEVKQRNGLVYVDYVKNIDFTLELSDDDVVQWKPYIECELDWHLGCYSKFVDICVHIEPIVHTLWKSHKFYKYNRGE